MDKWFLKDGQICFKDENAELNNWDLKSVVSCLNTRDNKIADLEAKLAERKEEINIYLNDIVQKDADIHYFEQVVDQLKQ